jgi:hypothetical protein
MVRFIPARLLAAAAIVGAIALSGTHARAGFTQVNHSDSPRNAREATHEQILEHAYGGNFTADGMNFSNGSVAVTRIDDATDSTWTQQKITSARAVASFARRKQAFGYFQGDEGGSYNKLFSVTGNQFDVSGGVEDTNLNGTIRFGRNENVDKAFSSLASENRDGKDHLVSYRVTGAGNDAPTYLLFWEDKWGRNSDFDFNDLVVEVGASSDALLIPLPPAAWSGLGGLAIMGMITGCKRTRRWIF